MNVAAVFLAFCMAALVSQNVWGQMQGGSSGNSSDSSSGGSSQTATSNSGAGPSVPAMGNYSTAQNPFMGSVPQGQATDEVIPLSFADVLDRALKNNLGLLLQSDNTLAARGQKWKELSALLPNLTTATSENVAKINLAAQGFRFSGPAFAGVPSVVGPFGFFDSRIYLKQSVLDLNALYREKGASENEKAAEYNYKNARDLVVLAVGNAYLEALAGESRVETANAQVTTAQALYEKSADQQKAGLVPAIDTLRAQVELQARQQQQIVAKNEYAKEKLTLGRVIGLPSGQQFMLTEKTPYSPLTALGIADALKRAYAYRSDYQAAMQQVRSAQYFRRAARAEHYPSIDISANFGDSSITIGNPQAVYAAAATVRFPIFAGNKSHADALEADAALHQAEQQLDNLRAQIDYEVRTSLLDLQAAADQVKVAQSSVDLAGQELSQAHDRFAAGVADNLEVVQAQESVASANENYISSLYAHNVAKVELAKAMGYAEQGVRLYLETRKP